MGQLSADEIHKRLNDLDGWERSGNSLRKQFKRDDFKDSVKFVDAIVDPAEELNHHPDVDIHWDTVTVLLSTHSEGGITENDFELAEKIDGVA